MFAIKQAQLGPAHAETLVRLLDLANAQLAAGRTAEALKLREERLSTQRASLGPDHPYSLDSMQSLADTYTGLGRHAEALKLREEVLAIKKVKLGPDHPELPIHMLNLAHALQAVGRTAEALPLMDGYYAANPQDLMGALRIAALWAWFGREAEFAAVRRRVLAAAQGSTDATVLERAAKLSSILPSADRPELDAALAIGRRAMEAVAGTSDRFHRRLALGMAAYRAGDDSACDEALRGAEEAGEDIPLVSGTAAFFRAMSLHRRGRVDEARRLAAEAAARMTPLPGDEKNPQAGNNNFDELVRWLTFKEARALIGFDAPSAEAAPAAK